MTIKNRKLDTSWANINRIADEYADEQIKNKRKWLQLRKNYIHNMYSLPGNCLKVLIYLESRVNRDPGLDSEGRTRRVWCDLGKYYNEGLLVTAATQNYIAKVIGIDQAQVSRAITQLEEGEYIKSVGYAYANKDGIGKRYTVYAVGIKMLKKGEPVELFYHELGVEIEPQTEEDEGEF